MNLRNKLGQFPLAVTMATILISSLSYAANAQSRTSLSGLQTVLIDAEINLNCSVETPDLCRSRKDISIPDQTQLSLKDDISSMRPGQELAKKQLDEINALKEANERLKGQGQEFQISENQARIKELAGQERPEYFSLKLVPSLWKSKIDFYQSDSHGYGGADNMIALGYRKVTIGYPEALRYENVVGDFNGKSIYRRTRISIVHSPEMMKSFVLKVDRFKSLSAASENDRSQYASESMVARCEERTIYNTLFGHKTTVAEEHLLCRLPEDRGFLRFKILN
ncbi:MAG: hypothetical protein JNJ49_00180 [Bdellovibrionaceae bacterium]|nr:hypothetical protein [Pseudobdellovibrionaceae bacterium]